MQDLKVWTDTPLVAAIGEEGIGQSTTLGVYQQCVGEDTQGVVDNEHRSFVDSRHPTPSTTGTGGSLSATPLAGRCPKVSLIQSLPGTSWYYPSVV